MAGIQVESMGGQFLKVPYEEDGTGAGGYAKEMSDEYKAAEKEMLRAATADSDIIVATALIPGRPAPLLIPEDAVLGMKVHARKLSDAYFWIEDSKVHAQFSPCLYILNEFAFDFCLHISQRSRAPSP